MGVESVYGVHVCMFNVPPHLGVYTLVYTEVNDWVPCLNRVPLYTHMRGESETGSISPLI